MAILNFFNKKRDSQVLNRETKKVKDHTLYMSNQNSSIKKLESSLKMSKNGSEYVKKPKVDTI